MEINLVAVVAAALRVGGRKRGGRGRTVIKALLWNQVTTMSPP
jgi:hypothetical protein